MIASLFAGAARASRGARSLFGLTALAAAAIAAGPAHAGGATAGEARQTAWQTTIAKTPVPHQGCFRATYPATTWKQVACTTAPSRPYVPRSGGGGHTGSGFTVGDGNDYSAVAASLISSTVGTFPVVTGLKSESGGGRANDYSLQINSQFFASPTCAGAANPATCLGWEQFVYTATGAVFMQYWLINYGAHCPSGGWMAYSTDCYRNSSAVGAPSEKIKQLTHLKLSGIAVQGGLDTVVFTTAKEAYSTTGNDSVVDLAAYWNASEWNIIGDGSGSQANFNKGTSITVNIALTDGSTAAPVCQADDGTTGETNNLNLGSCTVSGGTTPSVQFVESLAKK